MAHSQSDARVIWDYLCARMRIVMRGSPRRWAVLSLVAILHLLLAMMLAHIMRESTPLVSNQAIQVQFVSVPKTVPPPLPELPPTRRQSATARSEARRVGKEWDRSCSSRWWPSHYNKKHTH